MEQFVDGAVAITLVVYLPFASSPEKTKAVVVMEIALRNCSDVITKKGKKSQAEFRIPCQDITL